MEFNIKLIEADIQTIVSGLNELPRKISQPLLEKMQAQINEQLAAPPPSKRAYTKRKLKLVPQQEQQNVVA